ncbi:hypothetical protein MPH_04387, partial [Macrophomina phaseolina MS6]
MLLYTAKLIIDIDTEANPEHRDVPSVGRRDHPSFDGRRFRDPLVANTRTRVGFLVAGGQSHLPESTTK